MITIKKYKKSTVFRGKNGEKVGVISEPEIYPIEGLKCEQLYRSGHESVPPCRGSSG